MINRLTALTTLLLCSSAFSADRPNILWIFAEDTSPWIGAYGDKINEGQTPNIDSIAEQGVIFKRAYVPAPVCSAMRSAMMLGQNQIRFGAQHHRSSRGTAKITLPEGYKLLPQIMREGGYETFNLGKTDYNFVWNPEDVYSLKIKNASNPFETLKTRQPFFGQIQTKGGKNNTSKFPVDRKVNPSLVTVPKDYPQNEVFREVVAQHYDAIRQDDDRIGEILKSLKASGMAENTIVVYFSDHGANNLLRHKQMATEGGLHVPFVVKGPKKYVPEKQVRADLVSTLDLSATTLSWAGIEQPAWYEGKNLFADNYKERNSVASAKDRLDHTIDRVRTLRTDRYRYVKNYKLDRILLQAQYRDNMPYTKNIHELYQTGRLAPHLKRIYFGERPAEELYDVLKDPEMVSNLVADPSYQEALTDHRNLLAQWLEKGDQGYRKESVEELKKNGDGKKWVGGNVEYERYRVDSDGDGLSDEWEKLNGRDPIDGRLVFNFDCGAWQTEGWEASGTESNIAGFLGYLDFSLDGGEARLHRKNLFVQADESDREIQITLKSSEEVTLHIFANNKRLGSGGTSSFDHQRVAISLKDNENWNGKIESLDIQFEGNPGAVVEVDSIELIRSGS